MNSSRLVTSPIFAKISVLGPSWPMRSAAYLLSPVMSEITAIIVVTAMMMPRTFRKVRSAFVRSARRATRRTSKETTREPVLLRRFRRRHVVDLDRVARLQLAQRLERPRHDLVARL